MNIPELSISPLAHRLERVFESVNFRVRAAKAATYSTLLMYDKLSATGIVRVTFISCFVPVYMGDAGL